MNHPNELFTPSQCPLCGGRSWTKARPVPDEDDEDWQCNGCKAWLEVLAGVDAEQRLMHEKLMRGFRDPNMRDAAREITAVLRKHDLMGVVILTGPGDLCEHVTHLTPRWSCITEEHGPEGQGIRIKSKCKSDSAEAEKLRISTGGLITLNDVMRHIGGFLNCLISQLGKQMDISHFTETLPNPNDEDS